MLLVKGFCIRDIEEFSPQPVYINLSAMSKSRLKNITPFIVMDILAKARQFNDTVHMEVGEPDIAPPPGVTEGMHKAVKDKRYYYTSAAGIIELREKIAGHYKRAYDVEISPERIILTPGTSGAFLVALGILLDKGDRFCISDPSYPCYKNFGYFLDTEPVFVNVGSDTNFEITIDHLKSLNNIKAVIISSPSNPTGGVYSDNNFQELLEYCADKNIHLISDEIYHGLVYDKKIHTALEFSNKAIVINGFSKFFCMPGFRIGWMILPEKLLRKAEIVLQSIIISTNTFAQYAACEAFDYNYLADITETFKCRRDYLYSEIGKLFGTPAHPDGAFYIWADISKYMDDSSAFCQLLLNDKHVAITPGLDFGTNETDKFVRFAYTKSIADLEEGVDRIKAFLKENFTNFF